MCCLGVPRLIPFLVPASERRFQIRRRACSLFGVLSAVVLAMFGAPLASAVEAPVPDAAQVRIPQSPQDHVDLADLYDKQAFYQRTKARALRRSWAARIQRDSVFPNKSGTEFPWVTRLKRQAQAEISRADALVAEAERSADYHRMRARELEGLEFATLATTQLSSGGPQ